MPSWDAAQYLRFEKERTRPAVELLSRVELAAQEPHVVDLGCGPGNSTQLLHHRWPRARLVGVDSSSEMIARATADHPTLRFARGDVQSFKPPAPLDLAFANALFQWLPDHAELLPLLVEWLRPGGTLALQMPHNFDEPSHRLMRGPAPGWGDAFEGVRRRNFVLGPAAYYDLLAPLCRSVDVWQTTYQHVMGSVHDIVEWVRGTGIRPYLEALEPSRHAAYLAAYAGALEEAYPERSDGKRLLSFPRLFVVAVR